MVAMICLVGSAEVRATNSPAYPSRQFTQQMSRQPTGVFTNVARIVDFMLFPTRGATWGLTFQTIESNSVRCIVNPSHSIIQSNRFLATTSRDLDGRTDFSDLPWYKIVTETVAPDLFFGNEGFFDEGSSTLLLSWEPIETDAEQEAEGDGERRPAP